MRHLVRMLVPIAAGAVLLLSGCGKSDGAGAPGRMRLAVIPKETQHEFWKSVHAGARRAAAELDVDLLWQGPARFNDREGQVRIVENCVAARVQGLVLAPLDEQALVAAVEDAAQAGVPTVVIDSGLKTARRVAFVATDNRQGGVLAAERLGALLGGKGKVIVLRFQEGSASTMAREAGFLDTVRERFAGITIASDNQYGGDTERAVKAAESLLVAHPDVDGVFCPNESTTLGMLRALQSAGRAGKVRFVGFDASESLHRALREGHVHGLVLQDPADMGYRGVKSMVAHLRGEPVQGDVHTNLVLATPENCGEPAVKALLQPDLTSLGR